jgi:hypothetical protein
MGNTVTGDDDAAGFRALAVAGLDGAGVLCLRRKECPTS